MDEVKATEAQVIPTCAWCRKAIEGDPHFIYALGRPVASFCAACHASGYQAATGLMALGNALLTARRAAKGEKPHV